MIIYRINPSYVPETINIVHSLILSQNVLHFLEFLINVLSVNIKNRLIPILMILVLNTTAAACLLDFFNVSFRSFSFCKSSRIYSLAYCSCS